jgi:hypothetical protein
MRSALALASVLLFAGSLAAETRTVATTTKGKTTTQTSIYREAPEGSSIRVTQEAGTDIVATVVSKDSTVSSVDIRTKDGRILMTSDGAVVAVSGTWAGKEIGGRYELKGLGFYGNGFDYALRALARRGLQSLQFPMIDPANPAKAMVMELRREGTDLFKGKPAVKVKISLTGVMAAFWSASFLMAEDGTILKYEGNQGPGTPAMVTELIEVKP